ncbi:MAG: anthranilate phosphoribosyltransferase [Candidatus Dadabacteria bacterium RIFCSPHIGHO2_12_FULL_53_21]|nr:MAG: anthranilate phosphoribosyltransferase [Candidatus Dadabacteria bacterium RIFCSPHIGHO2_12_FULL_53_21]
MIKEAIAKVVERIDLEEHEMSDVVEMMMEGEATPGQISAFLVALRMKGESVSEITGAAKVMLDKAIRIHSRHEVIVDLCGTGGDRQGTFNVSTAAAFVVAGAGVPVAKHGNRSVSSYVGSADVLEALGIDITHSAEVAEKCLDEAGIVFLFAPNYHPAMKNVAGPRKEIGVRTIFNILGPIVNPAGVKHQVVGVYSEVLLDPVVKVLRNLGHKSAMVVHGADSMDEITVTGKTVVAELKDGMVKKYQFDPLDLGIKRRNISELKGGRTAKENARIFRSILRGEEKEAKRDIVLINAAAAIYVSETSPDLREALERAVESLDSGKALSKLEELAKITKDK